MVDNAGQRDIEFAYRLARGDFVLDARTELPMRGICGIFGRSGAGKTTLLRCLAGLEKPVEGRLNVAGEVWEDTPGGICRAVHERRIGYVFQEPRLFRHLDVSGNLDYAERRRRGPQALGRDRVVELLGLEALMGRRPGTLSGGEAQRVAIGRALLTAPEFVLMDEPLAALDQARREEILPFLDRLHAELSIPIVYVSHNVDEICRLCDFLVVLDGGRAVASGELQSVLVRGGLPVLSGRDAGSVVEARPEKYDADDDLTLVSFSGGRLWLPGRIAADARRIRLRIRASDVSLCRERPNDTTILNILPSTIRHIESGPNPSVLVHLTLGDDEILARVTRRSVRELNLSVGDVVLAQIKAAAVRYSPSS